MWLIRTSTGRLEHFNSPRDVHGGYAILSHVWQDRELTFQELQALRNTPTGVPRDHASAKVRDCCILAESHGFDWLWIDTCCIDRTSSAELSEALNSMYAWYSQAAVCYAYLHDVPALGSIAEHESSDVPRQFRHSKWFTRGWTLQELIAPRALLFLARDWSVIGTKAGLAGFLEDVTGIDATVLTFRLPVADVSVSRRMWWASARTTTRPEDAAYSLMGLFGVHMPTVYGEGGRRAFRRLQEEILKRTSDQTLFAWGHILPIHTAMFREKFSFSSYHDDSHLFAPSPTAFRNSGDFVPMPLHLAVKQVMTSLGIKTIPNKESRSSSYACKNSISLPDFTVTTQGVRSRLLVISGTKGTTVFAIAVLAAQLRPSPSTNTSNPVNEPPPAPLGLLFRRRIHLADAQHPRYHIGATVCGAAPWSRLRYRLAHASWACHALAGADGERLVARWETLYISHRASSRSPTPALERRLGLAGATPPPSARPFVFVFPRWLDVELRRSGFELVCGGERMKEKEKGQGGPAYLPSAAVKVGVVGRGGVVTFNWRHRRDPREGFRIAVGVRQGVPWATANISAPPDRTLSSTSPSLAANAQFEPGTGADAATERQVLTLSPHTPVPMPPPASATAATSAEPKRRVAHRTDDALHAWTHGTRTFADAACARRVQLTFSFTRAHAGATHALDVRVGGAVYRRLALARARAGDGAASDSASAGESPAFSGMSGSFSDRLPRRSRPSVSTAAAASGGGGGPCDSGHGGAGSPDKPVDDEVQWQDLVKLMTRDDEPAPSDPKFVAISPPTTLEVPPPVLPTTQTKTTRPVPFPNRPGSSSTAVGADIGKGAALRKLHTLLRRASRK